MQEIKTILSVYSLILLCLCIPTLGIYLLNQQYAIIYLSIILILMPLVALSTIFYQYYKLISNSKTKAKK